MRVATIDIGTNSVLLLVAERAPDGDVVAVSERATITRLGEGVDARRELSSSAIARTNACLDAYADAVREAGALRVAVVGTSAMRDARGGEAVRDHVRARFGVEARVISGDEEAALTFAGALSGLPVRGLGSTSDDSSDADSGGGSGAVVVFDIGGGSTEIVLGDVAAPPAGAASAMRVRYARSFDLGSVRLTERHVTSDPPSPRERDAIRDDARRVLAALPSSVTGSGAGPVPVGIAGTMTTLAAVAMKLATYDGDRVHGHTMTRQELAMVVDELAGVSLAARRELLGMEPKRADVIVAGGILALEVLDALGRSRVRISDRGVRWGLAASLLAA